jgi:predicted Zn-dependent protease
VLETPAEDVVIQPEPERAIATPPAPVLSPSPREQRPRRPPATLSPASRALVTQAQTQRRKGDLPGASVTLDRALRIEPSNPLLWIEMGRLRMDQRNYAQAENMARKALSMAVGDDATQSQAWELIAQSLRARGRNVEAEAAMDKARVATPD